MTILQSFINFSGPVSYGLSNIISNFTNKKENLNLDKEQKKNTLISIQFLLGFVLYIISLYILIKCERDTKNLVPVIIFSQLFPYIYVPYKLISGCNL